ncbi:MAG TPA: TylF/MycF/NovP-related O-methyltransferase [Bryobacteraceae bacterium]|nr:TylF/MycF/NovP-related O-methyltransferase [Bryobacteraceae bacterium]
MSRYLDLLARSVLGELDPEEDLTLIADGRFAGDRIENAGRRQTMIGRKRLENVWRCLDSVLHDRIPGDLIECGVWRGGAVIFMRGYLAAHDVTDRIVWAADSFRGCPKPRLPQDTPEDLSADACPSLAVSLDRVRDLFVRYGLLDDRVRFLPGWFADTLARAPIDRLALLRVDADLYESTLDVLDALYEKVSPGGFVIVDDYGCIPACREAVNDFRAARHIREPLEIIDWTGVFWRREARPRRPRGHSRSGRVQLA